MSMGLEEEFLSQVRSFRQAALNAHDTNDTLGLAALYGYLLRINSTKMHADDGLETALLGKMPANIPGKPSTDCTRFDCLHIVTDALDYGGHTPILKRWLEARSGNQHSHVVVVQSATSTFSSFVGQLGLTLNVLNGDLSSKFTELVRLGRMSKHVVLHLSPEDIVSALAARRLKQEGVQVLFVNHADHIFAYGRSAANTVLEVSSYGWRMTEKHSPGLRQAFLGIPMAPAPEPDRKPASEQPGGGPILSIGAAGKFEPSNGVSFVEFLNLLTAEVSNDVTLIGPTGAEIWWRTLTPLARQKIRFMGTVPQRVADEELMAASCLIESFPIGGGSVLTQALLANIPVHGLEIPITGYGFAEFLRSPSPAELVAAIKESLARRAPSPSQMDAKRLAIANQCPPGFVRIVEDILGGSLRQPPIQLTAKKVDLRYYETQWLERGTVFLAIPNWARVPAKQRLRLLFWYLTSRRATLAMGRKAFARWIAFN